MEALTDRIRQACDFMRAHPDEPISLGLLAERAGVSPYHFQRSFKAAVGLTPRQFLEAHRTAALKSNLRRQESVTDAIYESGFGSSSRVYEHAGAKLGMTPGEYRQSGRGVEISYAVVDSPLGRMLLGATDRGLCCLQFGDSDRDLMKSLREEYPNAVLRPVPEPYPAELRAWMDALDRHLRGAEPRLELPLDLRATAFQWKVWRYLQSIPYGSTRSYAEVAAAIGKPTAARAVARACATNRVSVVIPCHRVLRGTGAMGGYRWGIERKRRLLAAERAGKGA